jgi:hypothetical protein
LADRIVLDSTPLSLLCQRSTGRGVPEIRAWLAAQTVPAQQSMFPRSRTARCAASCSEPGSQPVSSVWMPRWLYRQVLAQLGVEREFIAKYRQAA